MSITIIGGQPVRKPKMRILGNFRYNRFSGCWTNGDSSLCRQAIRSIVGKLDTNETYEVRVYRIKPRGDSIKMNIKVIYHSRWLDIAAMKYKRPSGRRSQRFNFKRLSKALHCMYGLKKAREGVEVYFKVKEL